MGSIIENLDSGSYLTERLRTLHPESFEEEVVRAKRRGHRLGVLLGVSYSLLVVTAGGAAMVYFAPDIWDALLAGIR
jgi:hypothetical protein